MNDANDMNDVNVNDVNEKMQERDLMEQVKEVLDSERLLTARMVDSVLRSTQMASLATPEMQDMFDQWVTLIGRQMLAEIGPAGECDIPSLARTIGVGETTLFSLLVYLHRSGKIHIDGVRFSVGKGNNTESCGCLMA